MAKDQQYLVYGGELIDTEKREFRDPDKVEIVGIFPDYESAFKAWRGAAQRTVDNAQVRFFIVQINDIEEVPTNPRKK